jgi:hypothetical protein
MANTINATSTGAGGLITTGDDSGVLNIQTNETTAITVDASQNVGVGVTPSAWSGYKAIQLGGGSLSSFSSNNFIELSQNTYYASSAYKYVNTGYASRYQQDTGTHQWYVAASGSANATISFTQAMTLDASGRLGIGVTAPAAPIHVLADSNGYSIRVKGRASDSYGDISFNNNADTVNYAFLSANNAGTYFGTATALPLIFYTNNAEKARINSAGMLAVNYTSTISGGLFVVSSNGTKGSLVVKNDDSVQLYSLGTGTVTCSGGVLGFTSDERIKIDDGNYSGGLNAVLSITPKYFYYKNSEGSRDETKGRELGFFAQNIQQTCGFEVVHQPEDPDALLGIHDRGVMAVLVSAIQEQQALITQLQADVAALKGA